MKKRILAFLLAVSIAVSMLVLPASAAGNANTAVQLSITLNAMDSSQQAALNAVVTRGALARMLVSYSTYRESVGSQGTVGTLFTDLPGTSPYAAGVAQRLHRRLFPARQRRDTGGGGHGHPQADGL